MFPPKIICRDSDSHQTYTFLVLKLSFMVTYGKPRPPLFITPCTGNFLMFLLFIGKIYLVIHVIHTNRSTLIFDTSKQIKHTTTT